VIANKTYFRFRSVQQNVLAISISIGEALRLVVRASPILLFPLCSANTIGPVIRSPLIGEAQRIKKIRENFSLVLRIRCAPLRL
jgi:hypothetical protein